MVKCYREFSGFSAQVPVLQAPRIPAARRQLCLLSSSAVTAVPSGSSELAARFTQLEQSPTDPHNPPASHGESHLLLTSHFKGTNTVTTSELTHRKNRNAKEREWGEALLHRIMDS